MPSHLSTYSIGCWPEVHFCYAVGRPLWVWLMCIPWLVHHLCLAFATDRFRNRETAASNLIKKLLSLAVKLGVNFSPLVGCGGDIIDLWLRHLFLFVVHLFLYILTFLSWNLMEWILDQPSRRRKTPKRAKKSFPLLGFDPRPGF